MSGFGFNALLPEQLTRTTLVTNKHGLANVIPSGGGTQTLVTPWDTVVLDEANAFNPLTPDRIIVPGWVSKLRVTAHLGFPAQAIGVGRCGVHLFRNGLHTGNASPFNDVFYHVFLPYIVSADNTTPLAFTPWIAPLYPQEYWTVLASQTSGVPVGLVGVTESWFSVEFQ